MFVVSDFLDIEINLAGTRQRRLENRNPRRFQAAVNAGLDITLPAAAVNSEIRVFCERLQDSAAVDIAGTSVDTVKDLYLERSRAIRTFTPDSANIAVNLNLMGDQRAGTILAWLTADEIEISKEVFATYPFTGNLSPRTYSDRTEGGDDIVYVFGREPRLDITVNIRAHSTDEPTPDGKSYKLVRAMSPQGAFFFYGRNTSEAYIIGKSARRAIKHVLTNYGRESVQPVLMEVL